MVRISFPLKALGWEWYFLGFLSPVKSLSSQCDTAIEVYLEVGDRLGPEASAVTCPFGPVCVSRILSILITSGRSDGDVPVLSHDPSATTSSECRLLAQDPVEIAADTSNLSNGEVVCA